MSETTEDEDNMLVLVVEDEEYYKDDQQIQVPFPLKIKVEHIDNSEDKPQNKLIDALVPKEEENVKEEYDTEYLEEDSMQLENEEAEEYQIEFLEDFPIEYELDGQENYQDYSADYEYEEPRKKTPKRKTPQKKTPNDYVSYVKQLREECPKMAKNEDLLVEHLAAIMRNATPPEPPNNYCKSIEVNKGKHKYECTFCGAQRETLPLAARHFQFSHGEMYLTCYACGVNYKNTTSLYKHEKRCRAPDAALVLRARGCYLGRKGRGRPFITSNRFITSNMIKNTKSRFFCTKCPASFVHSYNLEAHENSHEGLRPYRCHLCITAYTSSPALKRHLTASHGDERYVCDHCGKKFKLKPALISHLDTHRTVRKHPCLYCERRFAQKPALRHHMNKVHLNLPAAHGCPVCPKRYARMTHVKEHMDRVHGLMMITRRMYFQALPTMTEKQVIHASKLFNYGMKPFTNTKNGDEEEYVLPEIIEEPKIRYFKKTKMKGDTVKNPELEETGSQCVSNFSSGAVIVNENDLENKEKPKEEKTQQLKIKNCLSQIEITHDEHEPKLIINEEINDDEKIQYKRIRKMMNTSNTTILEEKKTDDEEVHKILCDVKSTLNNQKKEINTQVENKTSYKIYKCGLMNQLKDEIEIPKTKKDKSNNLIPRTESLNNLEPGTEIPENVIFHSQTENVSHENDTDCKDHEKNKLISDFLEYLRSGVVPTQFYRDRQNKKV